MQSTYTIFGNAGFIGNKLTKKLSESGCQLILPVKGDLTCLSIPLGHVIYAAGLTADFRKRPFDTVNAHVCLINTILEKCDFESLTYLSSTRVYAENNITSEDAAVTVNVNTQSDFYNLSKLMGESICLNSGRDNIKIARLSNVVGIRNDSDLFIDQLIREGMNTGKVVFQTAYNSSKDYIHIDDVTKLIIKLANSPVSGVYNIASGENITHLQIANHLEKCLGFQCSEQPGAVSWKFNPICTNKIRSALDAQPRKFDDYFPDFLNEYKLNQSR